MFPTLALVTMLSSILCSPSMTSIERGDLFLVQYADVRMWRLDIRVPPHLQKESSMLFTFLFELPSRWLSRGDSGIQAQSGQSAPENIKVTTGRKTNIEFHLHLCYEVYAQERGTTVQFKQPAQQALLRNN